MDVSTQLGWYIPILTLTLCVLVVWILLRNQKSAKLPPGPLSLPIIGSILSLQGDDVRESLLHLAHKYGDIFTLDMGQSRTVVLAGFDVFKEVLLKRGAASSGRPTDNVAFIAFQQYKAVGVLEGEPWKTHRKLLATFMRDKQVGKLGFEGIVTEEIKHYLQGLEDKGVKPQDPSLLTKKAISNIINQVTFGQRFDYQDPRLTEMVQNLEDVFDIVGSSGPLSLFPWLRYLPGDLFRYQKLIQIRELILSHIAKLYDEHKQSRVKGEIRDVIDAYLEQNDDWKGDGESPFSDTFTLYNCKQMFVAGTETVTTTLRWSMIYMSIYPDIMSRVQKEIDDVIGPSRMVSFNDRAAMPYTRAVIHEIQRVADIVPLGVPHKALQDIHTRGYVIPAGTLIMPFHYGVHRDPKHWDKPYSFNPHRFLNERGDFRTDDEVIPYGLGPRICLGKSLAEMELFLFFVALLQRFDLIWPSETPSPKLTGNMGISHTPEPFEIEFRQR